MCRDYRRRRAMAEYDRTFSETKIRIIRPERHRWPNLEPQDDINPSDPAPIFCPVEGGVEMITARWWFVPAKHKGSFAEWRKKLSTFNARSEGIEKNWTFSYAFQHQRCLIPADGWYEWTAVPGAPAKSKKTKWLFSPRDGEMLCFAGIWDRAETSDAGTIDTFAMVMQPAGSPLNAWHDRAPVVLRRDEWAAWIDPAASVEALRPLMGPSSRDEFKVEYVGGPEPTEDFVAASRASLSPREDAGGAEGL